LLYLSRRQYAAHNWRVHLVLALAYVAVVVFHADYEYRQHSFFIEIFLRHRYRQDSIQVVLAIGGFIAMVFDIPGKNTDLVEVEG